MCMVSHDKSQQALILNFQNLAEVPVSYPYSSGRAHTISAGNLVTQFWAAVGGRHKKLLGETVPVTILGLKQVKVLPEGIRQWNMCHCEGLF